MNTNTAGTGPSARIMTSSPATIGTPAPRDAIGATTTVPLYYDFDTFEAAEAAGAGVWVTAKYTDKSELDAGGHYAGTVLYDFTPTLMDVLSDILSGENSGYYGISFSTGMIVSVPDSVPADVRDAVLDTMSGVEDGSIGVIRDTSKIGG